MKKFIVLFGAIMAMIALPFASGANAWTQTACSGYGATDAAAISSPQYVEGIAANITYRDPIGFCSNPGSNVDFSGVWVLLTFHNTQTNKNGYAQIGIARIPQLTGSVSIPYWQVSDGNLISFTGHDSNIVVHPGDNHTFFVRYNYNLHDLELGMDNTVYTQTSIDVLGGLMNNFTLQWFGETGYPQTSMMGTSANGTVESNLQQQSLFNGVWSPPNASALTDINNHPGAQLVDLVSAYDLISFYQT